MNELADMVLEGKEFQIDSIIKELKALAHTGKVRLLQQKPDADAALIKALRSHDYEKARDIGQWIANRENFLPRFTRRIGTSPEIDLLNSALNYAHVHQDESMELAFAAMLIRRQWSFSRRDNSYDDAKNAYIVGRKYFKEFESRLYDEYKRVLRKR